MGAIMQPAIRPDSRNRPAASGIKTVRSPSPGAKQYSRDTYRESARIKERQRDQRCRVTARMTYKKEQQNTAKNDSQRKPCCHYLLTKQLHPAGEQYRSDQTGKPPHIETASWRGEVRHIFAGIQQPRYAIGMLIRKIQCQLGDNTAQHRAKYRADQPRAW